MPRCTHKGCGKEFDDASNAEEICIYHPGAPIFHEGLKSWSCCNTVNKSVLDFDEFMAIAGCTRGVHSVDAPKVEPSGTSTPNKPPKMTGTVDGKEVYTTYSARSRPQKPAERSEAIPTAPPVSAKEAEDEDDLDATVPPGTACKRSGCKALFVSNDENRIGDGPGTKCVYHPGAPIFHEGSKGYFCCKRRVLEFEEFLKIGGCAEGRHIFVSKLKKEQQAEEIVNCRIDHYQTPSTVHVTVFARQTDKERSIVKIEDNEIHFDLYLPGPKRFTRSVQLFGPVDASASSFTFFGSKVEVQLKKRDARSWTLLERTDRDLGPVNFTFGVTGRTGTIGAKEFILDEQNSRNYTP